jgi:hypothetical protein
VCTTITGRHFGIERTQIGKGARTSRLPLSGELNSLAAPAVQPVSNPVPVES